MRLTTFENEVPGTILQRGKSYYDNGAVTDLQDMKNGQYFAIVEGNDDYEVDLRLSDDGEVLDYSCNCPYDGGICKHVIAVLYQIREEKPANQLPKKTNEPNTASQLSKKANEPNPWKNIISTVPEDELKKFVKEYAAKNHDFRNLLAIRFADYDNRDNRDKYASILNGIFSAAGDRHGLIDYHHTFGVMQQVYDLLARADEFIEDENYKEAFYIAASVAPACIDAIQDMDDSNGECGGAINDAFEVIWKIFKSNAGTTLKNEAFDWLLDEAGNPDYDDYGCDDNLYPRLVEAVDTPEKATRVLAFLDNQIENAASKEGWSKEYHTKQFMGLKIDVLNKIGQEAKAQKIITDNIHIHDFRKIVVEKCMAENNSEEAIRLIHEGIGIAVKGNYAGVVTNWKEMLMDIYKKQNNTKELRAIAKELYYSGRYEMKYYREYKATFGKEEWDTESGKIISLHQKEKGSGFPFYYLPSNLANVYIEEKMWGELYELLQNNININALLQYSHYVVNDYAPGLVQLYKEAIENAAERASDRRGYHEIATYILKMAEIAGGSSSAKLLTTSLLEKYNKRPAMKDELTKKLK